MLVKLSKSFKLINFNHKIFILLPAKIFDSFVAGKKKVENRQTCSVASPQKKS